MKHIYHATLINAQGSPTTTTFHSDDSTPSAACVWAVERARGDKHDTYIRLFVYSVGTQSLREWVIDGWTLREV